MTPRKTVAHNERMQFDRHTKASPPDHPYLVMSALAGYYGHLHEKCEDKEQLEVLQVVVESAMQSTQHAWDWSKMIENSSDAIRAMDDYRYLESLSRRFAKIHKLTNQWTLASRRYQLALRLEANLQRCLRIFVSIPGGEKQKRLILDQSRQRYALMQRLTSTAKQQQQNLAAHYAVPHKMAS